MVNALLIRHVEIANPNFAKFSSACACSLVMLYPLVEQAFRGYGLALVQPFQCQL
jgi:hypothetical protein